MSRFTAGELPWLAPIMTQLSSLAKQQRLAHALLLSGMKGVGKSHLAEALTAFLLCRTPAADRACGHCKSCLLLAAGNHPDWLQLTTENSSIGVDEIRRIIDFTQGSAQQQGNRVITLPRAERMTESAANALLKTLEEPPQGCYLLLQSSQPQRLKATLLSRCQRWHITPLTENSFNLWLASQVKVSIPAFIYRYTGGAPLTALALLTDADASQIASLLEQLHDYVSGKADLTLLIKALESRIDISNILGYFLTEVLRERFTLSAERQQRIQQSYYRWCRDEQQILGQNRALALSALLLEVKALLAER